MNILDALNPQQRKAVAAGGGPILVLAGPGSGKTRVLTQRVAYLIAEQRVPAYRIMAVTFTNKAAREMQSRVEKLLGNEATQGMWLGTFHAICARLLRRGLPAASNQFRHLRPGRSERLVKTIVRDFSMIPSSIALEHAGHRHAE
jgi:DNA helicase-2/ATP-dependent DNA helicase PcrA